jgi:hypothetical protein
MFCQYHVIIMDAEIVGLSTVYALVRMHLVQGSARSVPGQC